MQFYCYDLETMANFFSYTGKYVGVSQVFTFEISDRKNQRAELLAHLSHLRSTGVIMVGFNSLGFDWPILQELMTNPYVFDAKKAHQLCTQIISSQNYGNAGLLGIKFSERLIPQLDLVKINNFDNKSRRTSLKSLQCAMRSTSVEDLPYDPNTPINSEQMDHLLKYNLHDVTETERFFDKCRNLITIRQNLLDSGALTGDVLNYSDVKIGTEYLIKKIGRSKCFTTGREPRQTKRQSVAFKDVILPKISFRTPEFEAVHEWFAKQTIYPQSEEERPGLEVKLAGLDFKFGAGGVHASVENKYYESNDTHEIRDIDVSGMYVAVAIANGFYPEHLGQDFVTAYRQLQQDRKQYPKGSFMNLTLKLAGNGAYGNSNNPFSCFYDPKYTFSVTVNGQLQLLQLVEELSGIPGVELIQANTDGITALVPKAVSAFFDVWCRAWEEETGLKLEEVLYSKMWIADVNNYVSVTKDGKVKRKGKYWYPETEKDYEGSGSGTVWNKDFSNMVVPKAVEPVLRYGWSPEDVLSVMTDPFDFMARYKTTAGSTVYIGERPMLKTVRYYVSLTGQPMKKVSKPKGVIGEYKRAAKIPDKVYETIKAQLQPGEHDPRIHTKNKSKHCEVTTSIEAGRLVRECNHIKDFNWANVDLKYYADEIRKLIV